VKSGNIMAAPHIFEVVIFVRQGNVSAGRKVIFQLCGMRTRIRHMFRIFGVVAKFDAGGLNFGGGR